MTEPTDNELHALYGQRGAMQNVSFATFVYRQAQADERAARERKRGERPSHFQLAQQVRARRTEPDGAEDVSIAFDLGISYADSAESEELAALRAELARVVELMAAEHAASIRSQAERDTEKAQAEDMERELRTARRASDGTAQNVKRLMEERSALTAERDALLAELEAHRAERKETLDVANYNYEISTVAVARALEKIRADRDTEKARADSSQAALKVCCSLFKNILARLEREIERSE